jgi:transcriptional regulator with XRE-family HTH domain
MIFFMTQSPPVGERLRRLRRAAGLTLRELASRAGLDLSTVHKLEQGRIDNPRLNTLVALAEALGVTVAALVEGSAGARAAGKPGIGAGAERRRLSNFRLARGK